MERRAAEREATGGGRERRGALAWLAFLVVAVFVTAAAITGVIRHKVDGGRAGGISSGASPPSPDPTPLPRPGGPPSKGSLQPVPA